MISNDEQRRIVAYLDGLQVKGGEELRQFFGRTLMASILDKAFKGELS